MAEEAVCWLCGAAYRTSVTECADCLLPLIPSDSRIGATPDQNRVRRLADAHLSSKERDRVRPALVSLPDVLVEDEHVLWLTDAKHRRQRGVLAITTRALCWVPADQDVEAGAIDFTTIEQVDTWPGDGGQLRVTTPDDLHVFTEVGSSVWLGQFGGVLSTALQSPDAALAEAERFDRLDR